MATGTVVHGRRGTKEAQAEGKRRILEKALKGGRDLMVVDVGGELLAGCEEGLRTAGYDVFVIDAKSWDPVATIGANRDKGMLLDAFAVIAKNADFSYPYNTTVASPEATVAARTLTKIVCDGNVPGTSFTEMCRNIASTEYEWALRHAADGSFKEYWAERYCPEGDVEPTPYAKGIEGKALKLAQSIVALYSMSCEPFVIGLGNLPGMPGRRVPRALFVVADSSVPSTREDDAVEMFFADLERRRSNVFASGAAMQAWKAIKIARERRGFSDAVTIALADFESLAVDEALVSDGDAGESGISFLLMTNDDLARMIEPVLARAGFVVEEAKRERKSKKAKVTKKAEEPRLPFPYVDRMALRAVMRLGDGKVFSSAEQAAREQGILARSIELAADRGTRMSGDLWAWLDDEIFLSVLDLRVVPSAKKRIAKKLMAYDAATRTLYVDADDAPSRRAKECRDAKSWREVV